MSVIRVHKTANFTVMSNYHFKEKPIAEKPILVCPTSAKPIEEKPTQLNTNLIKNLYNQLYNELNTKDEELIGLYKEYISVRENMKAPLNEVSLEKLINRAKRLSNNNPRVEKILLETAIINGWKNIYPPRESELERMNQEVQSELREMFGLE